MEEIYKKISNEKLKLGFSNQELAKLSNVAVTTIARFEKKEDTTISTLLKICKTLGLEIKLITKESKLRAARLKHTELKKKKIQEKIIKLEEKLSKYEI